MSVSLLVLSLSKTSDRPSGDQPGLNSDDRGVLVMFSRFFPLMFATKTSPAPFFSSFEDATLPFSPGKGASHSHGPQRDEASHQTHYSSDD